MTTSYLRIAMLVPTLLALANARAGARSMDRQQLPTACRAVSIAAGPRGTETGGQFRFQEERTTFNRAHDSQVIVFFRWEATPGVHHLTATWRSLDGGSSATNAFDYTAKDRLFGAYWTIPLSPTMPTGKWAIDATVDGVACGSLPFEVVDADARPVAVARRPLAPAALYERLQAAFAELTRGATGRSTGETAVAFLIQPGVLATAFTAIDATDAVHVALGRADRREVTSVIAWDRRHDWALIPVPSAGGAPLPLATTPAVTGDRCYSIEAGPGGARVLVEGTVVGTAEAAASGSRFILALQSGEGVHGAPVVNEFGEVVGIIGGGLTPGRTTLRERLRARADLRGAAVVPMSLVGLPATPSAPVTLTELRTRGILIAPVVGEDSIVESGFSHEMQRNRLQPIDQREEFATADKTIFVFIGWEPRQRIRGVAKLQLFDADNRLVLESKPSKADFKPGTRSFSTWQMPVPPRPGVYRADVLVGDATMWRGFVTVR